MVTWPPPFGLQLLGKRLSSKVIPLSIDVFIWINKHYITSIIFALTKIAIFPMLFVYFIFISYIGTIYHKFTNIGLNEWFGFHLYKKSITEFILFSLFGWLFMLVFCFAEYFKQKTEVHLDEYFHSLRYIPFIWVLLVVMLYL